MGREVLGDAVLQEPGDVVQAHVARRVGARRLAGEVLLARALGRDDGRVAARPDEPADVGEDAVLAVELERDLRDQHESASFLASAA